MEVIGDQGPGKAGSRGLKEDRTKAGDKMIAVGIVLENPSPFDAAADDVMNRPRGVYSSLSRHAEKLATSETSSQYQPGINFRSMEV